MIPGLDTTNTCLSSINTPACALPTHLLVLIAQLLPELGVILITGLGQNGMHLHTACTQHTQEEQLSRMNSAGVGGYTHREDEQAECWKGVCELVRKLAFCF